METSKVAVALNPVPGFCVKSRATNDTPVHLTASDQQHPIHLENGLKIFVNLTWDPNVPPPPPASDDAIHRAMRGHDVDESNPDAWFVPIILSDARQDSDKGIPPAGRSAVVFDCVLNPAIKARSLKDPEFKNFIIELALQRIEAQTPLILSRQIGTPNIASKGKPRPRRVLVPTGLFPHDHPHRQAPPALIQEVPEPHSGVPEKTSPKDIPANSLAPVSQPQLPVWSCTQLGSTIRIIFNVPGVTRGIIPDCTLDVEPRRILLHVPKLYDLDINLDTTDTELNSIFGKNNTVSEVLKLQRMRNLNVDGARAEWHVADRVIILMA